MKVLETIFMEPALQALGWALLHSVWQIALISILMVIARAILPNRSASIRYAAACGALLLMLLLPLATAFKIGMALPEDKAHSQTFSASAPQSATRAMNATQMTAPVSTMVSVGLWQHRLEEQLESLRAWFVLAWFLGVFILSARLLKVWTYTKRLKRQTQPVLEQWQRSFERLALQLRVTKPVLILESSLINVPSVVGWLKPAVLVPTSALSGLTPKQLEAVVAHELAHIKRHDYLINILQSAIEVLLFYHPGVWWVSGWIRTEREYACDDLAAVACGDKLLFARALTEVERLRKATVPQLSMAANGSPLLNRIRRLVEPSVSQPIAAFGPLLGIIIFTTVIAGAAICQTPSTPVTDTQAQAASKRAADSLPASAQAEVPPVGDQSRLRVGGVESISSDVLQDKNKAKPGIAAQEPESRAQRRIPKTRRRDREPSALETLERLVDLGNRSLDMAERAEELKRKGSSGDLKAPDELSAEEREKRALWALEILNQDRPPKSGDARQKDFEPSALETLERLVNLGDRSLEMAERAQELKKKLKSKTKLEQ